MNLLKSLKIGHRLMLAFATVLALTCAVGAFSISRIAKVNDATADLATNWLVAMRALGEYANGVSTVRRSEILQVLATSDADRTAQEQRAQAAKDSAEETWQRYMKTVETEDERQLAKTIGDSQQAYYAAMNKVMATSRAGHRDEAIEMYTAVSRAPFLALAEALKKDVDYQTKGGDAAYAASQEAYAQTQRAVIALLVAAVAIGSVLAWLITRSITGPIGVAVNVARTVAAGDLTSDVQVDSKDETGQLLDALKTMNAGLVDIVGQVRNASDSIATGSSQIATGNADLSQRTEEQASNLQQTAASMEQLTATVKQNADTARAATQIASSASGVAAKGGEVVGRVVATMGEITASSKRIADIIGVIDGIAFQTNILALNAAVEAARAGEQGRGFAVVATEVRNLAQRSAQAAKEIKTLIGESVVKVEAGSALVDDAGKTMGEIVAQVKRVSDLIGEISASSIEQSTGIGQIGDAVSQLDQVTQQNAALVEESAAAAESLNQQAAQLARTVSQFKLERGAAGFGAAPTMANPAFASPQAARRATPTAARPTAKAATKVAANAKAAPAAVAPQGAGDDWTSF